ncbi:GNAT family N-acetyltransferase [Brasilonema sp. UFV-L1]|uniref:GNAT family N-acetyltransferase n=1 Tax=Brasilonema sp. UFV-L1 TaxID=2234130 RepID=UPI00145F7263|nr:GNAT family N-acetyltransferase [Brasilonema sp. UFV-L1]NMG06657.1 N-acetyltransferase [Brasilonema sp. UFV-L1]
MLEEIESFTTKHLDECASLYVEVFNGEPWNEQWSFENARLRLFETLMTPGFVGFVLRQDKLLGFVAGYCEQVQKGKGFYLKEICVRPDNQRQGVGTKLLDRLMDVLTAMEVTMVYLLTMKDGQAEAFYTQNGYQRSQRMILMSKRLSEDI